VPIALLLRARCLQLLDCRKEAIVDCRAHLAMAPDSAATHGLLALLMYEEGHLDSARKHVESALGHDPKQFEALLARASMCSDAREYDDAHACFSMLVEMHPHCGRAWLGLGLVKLSQMQTEAALSDIERAAANMPEHVGTWHVLAWIQILRSDVAAAEAAFQRALALDRNFAETHGGLAVIACLQGREVDAQVSIERALRSDPQSLPGRYAQMLLMHGHGRHADASAVLRRVLARVQVGGTRYRDLLNARVMSLRAGKEPPPDPVVSRV